MYIYEQYAIGSMTYMILNGTHVSHVSFLIWDINHLIYDINHLYIVGPGTRWAGKAGGDGNAAGPRRRWAGNTVGPQVLGEPPYYHYFHI